MENGLNNSRLVKIEIVDFDYKHGKVAACQSLHSAARAMMAHSTKAHAPCGNVPIIKAAFFSLFQGGLKGRKNVRVVMCKRAPGRDRPCSLPCITLCSLLFLCFPLFSDGIPSRSSRRTRTDLFTCHRRDVGKANEALVRIGVGLGANHSVTEREMLLYVHATVAPFLLPQVYMIPQCFVSW